MYLGQQQKMVQVLGLWTYMGDLKKLQVPGFDLAQHWLLSFLE